MAKPISYCEEYSVYVGVAMVEICLMNFYLSDPLVLVACELCTHLNWLHDVI